MAQSNLKHQRSNDSLRQFFNILFAISQIVVGYLPQLTGFGTPVSDQSAVTDTAVVPAGYAFTIWAPIFLFALVYAIWQALPWEKSNPLFRRIGSLTAIAFFGNTVWELIAQFITPAWPTSLVIICILVVSLMALVEYTKFRKDNKKFKPSELLLVYLPVSMLAGWITAATFANISTSIHQAPFFNFGIDEINWSISLIVLAGILAGRVVVWTRGNVAYALSVAWALVAIIVANWNAEDSMPVFWASALMLVYVIYRFVHVRKII